MSNEQLAIAKNDFLLSLYDGKDVFDSAAEYLFAWESLQKSPKDSLSWSLKATADVILKEVKQEKDDSKEKIEVELPEGRGYLYSRQTTHGEPTDHVWVDGLLGATSIAQQASLWPTYVGTGASSYKAHHFPYHESVHPMRKTNTVTGMPNFVELLRAFALGGHGEEEAEFEKKYIKHLKDKKSPLYFGASSKDTVVGRKLEYLKTQKLLGKLDVNGVVGNHQMDFYERDYRRWLLANRDIEIELEEQGLKPKEINEVLRNQHFDSRAKDWISDKHEKTTSFDTEGYEENVEYHPHALGLDGYMFGLEWFTPQERTAIMKHIYDEMGGVDDHDHITLPNGEKIPTARIIHNNIMRRTPDMNYMMRGQGYHGRNAPYRLESNESDYETGEGAFNQVAIGELSHMPYNLEQSFSHYILDEINKKHTKEGKQEISFLPRLKLHTTNYKDEYNYSDLLSASKNHYKNKTPVSPYDTRLPIEDLLFLAGFHPQTRKPMLKHPIHGKMQGPIIPLEKIEELEQAAKEKGTLPSLAKDMRNDRGWLTSPFGPHIDEEADDIWNIGQGYRYGPALFWSKMYQNVGGQGMSLATWLDLNNSVSHDNNESSMFRWDETGHSYYELHPNNKALGYHFAPEKTTPIGHYDVEKKMFVKEHSNPIIQNILSPVNSSKKTLSGKNNYTEHKTAINPLYEYSMRTMTSKEKKELGSHNQHMTPHLVSHPVSTIQPKTAYGERPTDSLMVQRAMQAHLFNTFLGRQNHPNQPAKKSVASLQDLLSGDLSVSGGDGLQDFLDFMGWQSKPISPNMLDKLNIDVNKKEDFFPIRVINSIGDILNTNSPSKIVDFLNNTIQTDNNENYSALKNRLGFGEKDELNVNQVVNWFQNFKDNLHEKRVEESKSKNQKATTKITTSDTLAMNHLLSLGGMLPAREEENKLRESVEQLNERLTEEGLSPEGMLSIREELADKQNQLTQLENKAKQSVSGKPSNHWKIAAQQTLDLLGAHRKLVAEVARDFIIPKYLEHDENAFSIDDPQQFIWNTQRAFSDAERYLHTTSNHGLSAKTYGISMRTSDTPKQHQEHKNIANTVNNAGFEVNGNMSVDEVLEGLNLKKTPQMKEYVRSLIEQSNLRQVPFKALTVRDLLLGDDEINIGSMSNNLLQRNEERMNIPTDEASHEDLFHQDVHNNDIYSAIDNLQTKVNATGGNWSSHYIHRMPQMVQHIMSPQRYKASMQQHGLEMLNAAQFDPHNALGAGKGVKKVSRKTKNGLDNIIFIDPEKAQEDVVEAPDEIIRSAGITSLPIGAVSPTMVSLFSTFNSGQIHNGHLAEPSLGAEFDSEGNIHVGNYAQPMMAHSVPQELMEIAHSPEAVSQVLQNAPPPQSLETPQSNVNPETYSSPSDEFTTLVMSEASEYVNSLIDPDVLLIKSDEADWAPPIRPMHRIFNLNDIDNLRGFSGSWVVSKWYDGKRIIIVKNDDNITVYDENKKKVGVKKSIKENIEKISDKNYTVDAILGEEEIHLIDIINYDDNNIADMLLFERMKILRGQFDSYENVIVPGPHDTRITDEEGLEDSVKEIKKEHDVILLRDNKSTYMKGETRHPKWLLLRETKDFNFIVLDRRGTGPYTYQLGAGPINNASVLGNRAITLENKDYMDIGTARNQQKLFKVGDIVRAKISGLGKKRRGGRDIYNVHIQEIVDEGEGEGAASAESLDLLTKSFSPILIPHDVDIEDNKLKIILKDIDTVNYEVEYIEDKWYLQNVTTDMGDLRKSNYSLSLADSLQPFWEPIASLMLQGYIKKLEMKEKKPPSRKRQEKQSAGVLDADDEKRILKPTTIKAAHVFARAIDMLTKEKMTWTGPKGLGIDMATPVESPQGPTKLTEDSNLPDYDGKKRFDEEDAEDEDEEKESVKHIDLRTNAGESIAFDKNKDEVTISQK